MPNRVGMLCMFSHESASSLITSWQRSNAAALNTEIDKAGEANVANPYHEQGWGVG